MRQRGPKPKSRIICYRCGKECQPVREIYCMGCASTLVRKGELERVLQDNTPHELSIIQDQVLFGLLLGDGCLYRRKNTHLPYLMVQRARKDKGYLMDNYNVFKYFCKNPPIDGESLDKRSKKINYWSKFSTRRCGVFKKYYEEWYPFGAKILPKFNEISPLSLAVWFADDGSIRPSCSPWRYRMQFSTESFKEEDVARLSEFLKEITNEKFHINKSDGNFRICSADAGSRSFLKIIDPYFPESMVRKAYWRKKEACFYTPIPKLGYLRERNEYGRFI